MNKKHSNKTNNLKNKIMHLELSDNVNIDDTHFKARMINDDYYRDRYKLNKKKKISGESKHPAIDLQIYDRTNPDKTIKVHQVKEHDGEKWNVVYDKTEKFESKRRMKKK
ncbi:MAG: hypothetical protein ACFFKA_04440 [Candidatus Thorarchaeota archaeon]